MVQALGDNFYIGRTAMRLISEGKIEAPTKKDDSGEGEDG
jgi:hypothetical protein